MNLFTKLALGFIIICILANLIFIIVLKVKSPYDQDTTYHLAVYSACGFVVLLIILYFLIALSMKQTSTPVFKE